MKYPFVKVFAETWEYAPRLHLLFRRDKRDPFSAGDAFMLICTLYRWGQSLGPEGQDPTGLCESPRAVRLMAAALGVPLERADELAACLEDLGLIEVLHGGPVRVKGVLELYAGLVEGAEARSSKAKKAAEARWARRRPKPHIPQASTGNARTMLGASTVNAPVVLPDAKTQTQTQTQMSSSYDDDGAPPPPSPAVQFFEWFQAARTEGGWAHEESPPVEELDAFLASVGEALKDPEGATEALKVAAKGYAQDAFWLGRALPWAGFVEQWARHVRKPRRMLITDEASA